jgi:hypothetical protein
VSDVPLEKFGVKRIVDLAEKLKAELKTEE